jgi:hypothetical protein
LIQAFQQAPKNQPSPVARGSPVDSDEDKKILCAACGAFVATESARIEGGGRFTNPGGFTYDVVCLRQTACYVDGKPTTEASWFAGHAWRFAYCGGCHGHLGWYYEGATKFFGLIADRLRSA